jgi:hypothetical protein
MNQSIKLKKTFGFFLISLGLLIPNISYSDTINDLQNCKKIKESQKRLACFDLASTVAIAVDESIKENLKKSQADKASVENLKKSQADASLKQSMLEVLQAMRKMSSRVETGISYKDYSAPLSDLVFALESLLKNPAADKVAQFTNAATDTINHYKNARGFWERQIKFGDSNNIYSRAFVPSFGVKQYIADYPSLKEVQATYLNQKTYKTVEITGIYLNDGLSTIWGQAAKSAQEAEEEFKRQ